ncbi:hypothetical protein P8935_07200 [Telmatobacter sp. DSM 110680]|uniref:Mannosylglycerate hydrolase MGH1-like glycoside hydrolase domain-containing protein n=1 Tax=Telmatobacter sp. DSM 110680 TaxID=3036704 RepID=A0AAU7DPA6_9BACT
MYESRWTVNAGRVLLLVGMVTNLAANLLFARGQQPASSSRTEAILVLDTETFAPHRFIAVHGRRSLIQGYVSEGMEVWAYPFQILSGYSVAFRPQGSTAAINGKDLLSRVTYKPESVTCTYLGPDFIVRETLFVPLDHPGAILSYSVEGAKSIDIEVRAIPVMNLMWPAGVGGQSYAWNSSLSAFVLSEPENRYSATVGSPDIVAHDNPSNSAIHDASQAGIGLTLRPGHSGIARLFITLNSPHADSGSLFNQLIRDRESLEAEAATHFREVTERDLRIETPDSEANKAIAWAEIAIDQAWVCNLDLGCGYVAGYGATRGTRRPQYEWFFAGDGMVAAQGAMSAGDLAQARAELEFILRYQDRKTGMIWHELSQSAHFIDWGGKYPYMFVHVDVTFQFLGTLASYVDASGDSGFANQHWDEIEAAYRYCRSVIDPATALPRIPADKEGGNEQDRMSDDLGLSTSWVTASTAFAHLATITGHNSLAAEASKASGRARNSIGSRYWSSETSFWISGHDLSGKDMAEQRSGPGEALSLHLFGPEQTSVVLDQLASNSFQTDWGTRGIGAGSAGFDPDSYAKGSVWPVGTAALAETFWSEHRPVSGLSLWMTLLPLGSLDSPGHMPEVLAGNFYRPQIESVPEQTWSSAGFLDATVHGLLGLQVDSINNHLSFAPRLPANWANVSLRNIGVSHNSIAIELHRKANGLKLTIENPGAPFKFDFTPDIPLGATIGQAVFNHRPIAVRVENFPQQTEARIALDAPHGQSEIEVEWRGGVSIVPERPRPLLGDPDTGIRLVSFQLQRNILTLIADVPSDRNSHVGLQTGWTIASVQGVVAQTLEDSAIDLTFAASPAGSGPYRRARATVEFKP